MLRDWVTPIIKYAPFDWHFRMAFGEMDLDLSALDPALGGLRGRQSVTL